MLHCLYVACRFLYSSWQALTLSTCAGALKWDREEEDEDMVSSDDPRKDYIARTVLDLFSSSSNNR